MGNSNHKTMFKWSISDHHHNHHLTSSTTSSFNKFVAVEKRRRRRQNLANCCRQTTAFLFSHVGLSAMIVAYTVMGGFLFRALEGPFEKEEKNRVADVRTKLINEILLTTDSMGCYADESKMQFVRNLRDFHYSDSDGSKLDEGWNYSPRDDPNTNNTFNYPSTGTSKHYSNFRDLLPNVFSRNSIIVDKRRSRRHIDPQSPKRWQKFSSQRFNRSTFNATLHLKFKSFALEILRAIKESGWNGQDDTEEASMQWSHAGAILYAITVITTIGYGHIAPKTDWGRIMTIIYALIGIPLTFLYLSNIGNFLADCFRIFYKRVCCDVFCCKKCERQRKRERLKLRKQRVDAIQRGLVMRAAMNTLMVDYGRHKPYCDLRSVDGIHMHDEEESVDDVFSKGWIDNRRALTGKKSDCVSPQHYPMDSAHFNLPCQAFQYDSSSTSEDDERRKSRKRVRRANFKGVTILEPKSFRRNISRQNSAARYSSKSSIFPDQTASHSKHIRFNPSRKGDSCDILKDGRVRYNKGAFDDRETNLLRIRRDSIFQSDSRLVSNKQSDVSKSVKHSSKTGKLLKKSLSVLFFNKHGKSETKNDGSDVSKRKSRFPSRSLFKLTSKSNKNSNNSNGRYFLNWQKRKRKEKEDKAKENWRKLIAYSRQLTEENRRLAEATSNPYYNSLPLKAESRRRANNEILNHQLNNPFAVPSNDRKMFSESSSRHILKSIDGKRSSPHRSKSSERTGSKARKSDEVPLTSNPTPRSKRSKRKITSKPSSEKAADGNESGVKHIDSKNSFESYVTAICQSSVGEEETAVVARSTNVARSFKKSKTCIETKQTNNKTAGKTEKMADVSRKTKNISTKKRKTTHLKEKSENKLNPLGRSVSDDDCTRMTKYFLPTTSSIVDHNQIFLGNSYSNPCVPHPQDPDDDDDVAEDDDCSKVTVPIYICLILISGYLFAGSALFSFWEGWNTITGSYFCFITLSTIGFGDIVPGTGVNDWASQAKLVLCTLWLALGLSLLAMCFNLMQEEVKERCRKLGVKLGLLKDDCKPIYE